MTITLNKNVEKISCYDRDLRVIIRNELIRLRDKSFCSFVRFLVLFCFGGLFFVVVVCFFFHAFFFSWSLHPFLLIFYP